jgi:hypothetical protein
MTVNPIGVEARAEARRSRERGFHLFMQRNEPSNCARRTPFSTAGAARNQKTRAVRRFLLIPDGLEKTYGAERP